MSAKNTAVIGLQFGDEGKGKLIDILAESHDVSVRYQGGNNAGHTVCVNNEKHVFHLLPSGVLYQDKQCVLGNGMVVNPVAFLEEIANLPKNHAKIFLSDRANVLLPKHIDADKKKEQTKKIGTTQKGIGPCYTDKISRDGVRFCDYWSEDFEWDVFEKIKPYVCDTRALLQDALDKNKKILFEGAQATLLDVDHGTYPFVTSSSTSIGGLYTGTGVRPKDLKVIGVAKAYTTRVGEGPFPTELNDAIGKSMREIGQEFGATTGRPRRCGWFDAVVVKYACEVNGADEIALTKLDVLTELKEIAICTKYYRPNPFIADSEIINHIPSSAAALEECVPQYIYLQGWNTDISKIKKFSDLPRTAKEYVSVVESLIGVPITYVGVGTGREQMVRKANNHKIKK